MRRKRTMRLGYQAAACGLCRSPIDFPSGFWFDTEEALGIVHPDCMIYDMERGFVQPGDTISRTCGEAACVRPDHLVLHHPPAPCTKDVEDWIGRPGYAIGCEAPEDAPWSFDHFHAIVDGTICDCIHETHAEARLAHGQSVEA